MTQIRLINQNTGSWMIGFASDHMRYCGMQGGNHDK
jgi:hypothetical protein